MGTAATAAKARYNKKNYDNVTIRTRKGGNEAINELAYLRRKSKSDYIRDLIRQDANRMRRPDLASAVGSGNRSCSAGRGGLRCCHRRRGGPDGTVRQVR